MNTLYLQYLKPRHEQRKRDGVCTACGGARDRVGLLVCSTCSRVDLRKKKYHRLRQSGCCVNCGVQKEDKKALCPDCCSEFSKNARAFNRKRKQQALDAYGRICQCCGEDNIEFLTIDHIDGGGSAHRRITGGGGSRTYNWLRCNGYPAGYQVLCMNCNMAKGAYGYCPHQKAMLTLIN